MSGSGEGVEVYIIDTYVQSIICSYIMMPYNTLSAHDFFYTVVYSLSIMILKSVLYGEQTLLGLLPLMRMSMAMEHTWQVGLVFSSLP